MSGEIDLADLQSRDQWSRAERSHAAHGNGNGKTHGKARPIPAILLSCPTSKITDPARQRDARWKR